MSDDYKPPPGPPPSYTARQGQSGAHVSFAPNQHSRYPSEQNTQPASSSDFNPFRRAHNPPQEQPQSSQQGESYLPPPGPPPSKQQYPSDEKYQAPPGPPPSKAQVAAADAEPPPYDAWMSVPDTSQLPPPPSLAYDESPTANATGDEAHQARMWCRVNPLYAPRHFAPPEASQIHAGDIPLGKPPNFQGEVIPRGRGTWLVRSRPNCQDTAILAMLPSYCCLTDAPATTGRPKTIYYEIRVQRMGGSGYGHQEADAGIAIGFVAPPYPPFRLPGWERGSLGVHGDDGRRYVDDNGGGKDFTTSFQTGEVVGIGMTFSPPRYRGQRGNIEVFFTRQGKKAGGWDLFEERDRYEEGSVQGLDGWKDLLACVGLFGGVEFEVRFRREEWLYRP